MPAPAWQPSVADVGALLRARTVDPNGKEWGTFTANTRPTEAAAETLIALAVGQIQGEIGPEIPDVLHDQAKHCAILGAAVLIERSYWPEQQDDSGRAPSAYVVLHERAMAALAAAQRSYAATASAGGGMGLATMRVRSLGEIDEDES